MSGYNGLIVFGYKGLIVSGYKGLIVSGYKGLIMFNNVPAYKGLIACLAIRD